MADKKKSIIPTIILSIISIIWIYPIVMIPVSYTHLRAHETGRNLVCRLLLEKKKNDYATIGQGLKRILDEYAEEWKKIKN